VIEQRQSHGVDAFRETVCNSELCGHSEWCCSAGICSGLAESRAHEVAASVCNRQPSEACRSLLANERVSVSGQCHYSCDVFVARSVCRETSGPSALRGVAGQKLAKRNTECGLGRPQHFGDEDGFTRCVPLEERAEVCRTRSTGRGDHVTEAVTD
jgi:hypothetical protein